MVRGVSVRRGATAVLTAALALIPAIVVQAPAQAAGDDVTIVGHGWGHGRGLSQYGALGYVVNYGWTYQQIVAHYYGGTTLGDNPRGDEVIDVELTGRTSKDTAATGSGLTVDNVALPAGMTSVRLIWNGTKFRSEVTSGVCGMGGSTWQQWQDFPAGAELRTPGNRSLLCDQNEMRTYRGSLVAVLVGGTSYTFNRVSIEDYLHGVVPRESPASWADLGGGKGAEALKAQAVAARSYALASRRASGARTCDTTACQVYGGVRTQAYGVTAVTELEDSRTDKAIADTARKVMLTSSGAVARTEFSSSSGGWTAGGVFPAVEDLGDAISGNPNHNWTVTLTRAQLASKLGLSSIASFQVTERIAGGAEGGRVKTAVASNDVGAATTFTGNDVRLKLGLKSDWFTVYLADLYGTRKVVSALYLDLFGRDVDPSGLETWTDMALRDGDLRQVAQRLTSSDEYLKGYIESGYKGALQRDPDPGGQATWLAYLKSGRTYPELLGTLYGSAESLSKLGGGDVQTWVNGVYRSVLGRSAAASERTFWADRAAVVGRGAAALSIVRSDEAGKRRLVGIYQRMLSRNPDPSGVVTFVPIMARDGDVSVAVRLALSPEYWSRAQSR